MSTNVCMVFRLFHLAWTGRQLTRNHHTTGHIQIYHERGKIHWAKLSRFLPNVVFHRKTCAVPYVYNTKTTPLYKACIIK